MTSVSTLDLLMARWSGLLASLGLLAGLIAYVLRERTRKVHRENGKLRVIVAIAVACALLAVVGRVYPLVK